jgi:aminopeptidase N
MRSLVLFVVAELLIMSAGVASEKPFSFKETPGKLPKEVVPTDYSVRIVPDIDKLTFAGTETVKLNVRSPVRQLVLNALELKIEAASIDGKQLPTSAIKANNAGELLVLTAPSELSAGEHTLTLRFTGKINQQGQGLFYMRYQEQGSGARKIMLGTQFEPTDARRFFPCWDEPIFRARFQLTVVVPEHWLAVSNMPIEREEKIAGGREVRFAATPPMSSYLNVFVAGELDFIESRSGSTHLRVIATRGKAEMGRYALEATAQILEYYNTTTIISAWLIHCQNWIKSRCPAALAARWKTGAALPITNRSFYLIRKIPPRTRSKIFTKFSRTKWRTNGSAIW